jgi:nicotinamidase/pyrazinamidase
LFLANSCLLIIDPQVDFSHGGSLQVSNDVDSIYDRINKLLNKINICVISQDYHPSNHSSFSKNYVDSVRFVTIIDIALPDKTIFKQVCWPTHCVQGSDGVKFSHLLHMSGSERIVRKGTIAEIESYSAVGDSTIEKKFEMTQLIAYLNHNHFIDIYICGLAYDFCVGNTALDLALSNANFNIHIITDCTRYVHQSCSTHITNGIFTTNWSKNMTAKLIEANIKFITSNDIANKIYSEEVEGDQLLQCASEFLDISL